MRIDATEADFAVLRDYKHVNGVWIYVGEAKTTLRDMSDLLAVVDREREAEDEVTI